MTNISWTETSYVTEIIRDIGSPEAEGDIVHEDMDLEALFNVSEVGAEDSEANAHKDVKSNSNIKEVVVFGSGDVIEGEVVFIDASREGDGLELEEEKVG